MSAAHQLSTLLAELNDTCMLLQHQSRAMQQVFAEVLQHWTDPRGQRLVQTHLEPQAQLLGPTNDALVELTRALEVSARLAEQAQAQLAQARGCSQRLGPRVADAVVAGQVEPAQAGQGR